MDFTSSSSRLGSAVAPTAQFDGASQASSTRHMLADMSADMSALEPPSASFASPGGSLLSFNKNGSETPSNKDNAGLSLSVNYLPSKFSNPALLSSNVRKRRSAKDPLPRMPKLGGGVEVFKSGEARMPGQGDEDYDGVSGGWFGGKTSHKKTKLRWNRFKWILFFANFLLTTYSLVALVFCLITWFDVWKHADVIRVANRTELVLSTLAASLGLVTSIIGWAGILLNNRSFLAVYTFMLWVTFVGLVTPGYVTYKRRTFNLEGKINSQWSRSLGSDGRLTIQNQLGCCGYFSPFVEATVSQTCYARSVLPGCKLYFLDFERIILKRWYLIAFGLVPLQIGVILAGLLCSNHITYRFGKGMMPKAYRLSMNSMAVIMDNYAAQLTEQYGSDVASEAIIRSRSNLFQLDATMPYSAQTGPTVQNTHDSLGRPAAPSRSS